jgi:hypothetical protein
MQREVGIPRFSDYQKSVTLEKPIALYEARSILDGRSFLWFYGRVVYKDVFGKSHETRFCWIYNGMEKSFHQYNRGEEGLNCRT